MSRLTEERAGLRRPSRRRAGAAIGLSALVAAALPMSSAFAAPTVVGGDDAVSYTEQAAPVLIGAGVTIADGTTYAGEYVEFAVGSATATELLSLAEDEEPTTTTGVVSIVDGTVYLGNGTTADVIGAVDPVRDGRASQPLRVTFTVPFTNPSFESSDITGWTVVDEWIDLGVTEINGHVPTDTSTYPGSVAGAVDRFPADGSRQAYVQAEASAGTAALRMQSNMTTANDCDVVHGPAVYSSPFEAAAGDKIYFDWRAYQGSDNYHVFGYIVDGNGVQTEVLDATGGGTTDWTTKETVIPASGEYEFVFVSGTHDLTCGRAAGASLIIDNVRVFGTKVTDDVAEQIAQRLLYANTSDDPPASRTVTVTAKSSENGTGSDDITVDITPVDDAPILSAVAGSTFTNTEGPQTYGTTTGTLSATDPDDDTFTFGIVGGETDATTIGATTYTHSKTGTYGVLRVSATTGAYAFVPDATAIDGRLTDATESFTFRAGAGALHNDRTFTVDVSVPASAPGAPVDPAETAGPAQVSLTWDAPVWTGGSPIREYVIESSLDGISWTEVDTTTDTSFTVTGLTNGVPVQSRMSATNATGTGAPSAVVTATPVDVAGAPSGLGGVAGNEAVALTWTAPAVTGGTPVTGYRIESSTDGTTWDVVVADTASTATAYTVEDLTNGVPVAFRVLALNAVGTGPGTDSAAVTPHTVPGAPDDVRVTPGDGQATLTWAAPSDDGGAPVTGYRVESSPDGSTWTTAVADTASPATTYTVAGLPNGASTSFRVTAINVAGSGPGSNSAVVSTTPRTTPGAVTITSVESADHTLTVAFTAPTDDGGTAVTTYEYSVDGGITWQHRRAGTTASPLVIGGLTNGVAYPVMIRAVNAAGPGQPSPVVASSPSLGPVPVPGDTGIAIPTVLPGESALVVDGESRPVTVSTTDGVWHVTGDDFTVQLAAFNTDGTPLTVDAQGRLVVSQGGTVQVSGTGFRAGSLVDVWLFSTPYLLGEVPVGGNGSFAATLALPAGIAAGAHTVQLNGLSDDGKLRTLSTGLVVLAAGEEPSPSSPQLATTGSDVGSVLTAGLLLLLAGAGAIAASRIRCRSRG